MADAMTVDNRCERCRQPIIEPSLPWMIDGKAWHLSCLAEHDAERDDDATR